MLQYYMPLVGYPYAGQPTDCPVCGSAQHSAISRFDRRLKRLSTVMCDDCGLFFTNPMPTEAELELYYRTQYRLDYQFAFGKPRSAHIAKKLKEAEARHAALLPFLGTRKIDMLDFGCGSGELVRKFALEGHSATGLEPGSTYAGHAGTIAPEKGTFRIDNKRWQDVAYPEKGFDLVTMLHVLEHLPEPVSALQSIHRWLADDGLVHLEVPNMQGYALKGLEHFHFAHVLGFSRDNLIATARRAGFVVVHEFAPTSLLLAKAGGKSCPAVIDLAATANRNRAEYSRPFSLPEYLGYHARRLTRRHIRRP